MTERQEAYLNVLRRARLREIEAENLAAQAFAEKLKALEKCRNVGISYVIIDNALHETRCEANRRVS